MRHFRQPASSGGFQLVNADRLCQSYPMRVLIVGCGYVGLPLAAELARAGHEVFGVRRGFTPQAEAELNQAGIRPIAGDISNPETYRAFPQPLDWVVNTVSSSSGGADDYRRVYLEGTRHLLEWLRERPLRKFVYTSSTSVYGQQDGSQVKETSHTEPGTPTGDVLLQTEGLVLEAFRERQFPAVILRVAGIYGPDRGHHFKQFIKKEARIPGKGERLMNMVHRDDVVGAIQTALKNGRPGEIYNVVDDEPVAQIHFFRWLSETLGASMPPFVPESAEESKRGRNNKRVSNRKLKMELGYAFKYPNFRKGYTAEIIRREKIDRIEIEPDPR